MLNDFLPPGFMPYHKEMFTISKDELCFFADVIRKNINITQETINNIEASNSWFKEKILNDLNIELAKSREVLEKITYIIQHNSIDGAERITYSECNRKS